MKSKYKSDYHRPIKAPNEHRARPLTEFFDEGWRDEDRALPAEYSIINGRIGKLGDLPSSLRFDTWERVRWLTSTVILPRAIDGRTLSFWIQERGGWRIAQIPIESVEAQTFDEHPVLARFVLDADGFAAFVDDYIALNEGSMMFSPLPRGAS